MYLACLYVLLLHLLEVFNEHVNDDDDDDDDDDDETLWVFPGRPVGDLV